jgi:hypothetical protein
MKNQKLKIKNEDTLKGTGFGSLGWTESAKMNSTVKRLLGTFQEKEVSSESKNKNKTTVTCSECNQKFKTNNGKLPEHNRKRKRWYELTNEIGVPSVIKCEGSINDKKPPYTQRLKRIVIGGVAFKIGDKVLYEIITKGSIHWGTIDKVKVLEGIIDQIVINQSGTIVYFERDDNDEYGLHYIRIEENTQMVKL